MENGVLVEPETLYDIFSSCADVSSGLADWFMLTFLGKDESVYNLDGAPSPLMKSCLDRLLPSYFDTNSRRPLLDPETLQVNAAAVPDFISFFLDAGANPNPEFSGGGGTNFLGAFLSSDLFRDCPNVCEGRSIKKEILSALIEAGAEVSFRDGDGYSVGDYAWGFGQWDAWCGALQENGMAVMEVDMSRPQGYYSKR